MWVKKPSPDPSNDPRDRIRRYIEFFLYDTALWPDLESKYKDPTVLSSQVKIFCLSIATRP